MWNFEQKTCRCTEKKASLVKLMCLQHTAFIISLFPGTLTNSHKQLTLFLWLFYSQSETSSFSREAEKRGQTLHKLEIKVWNYSL